MLTIPEQLEIQLKFLSAKTKPYLINLSGCNSFAIKKNTAKPAVHHIPAQQNVHLLKKTGLRVIALHRIMWQSLYIKCARANIYQHVFNETKSVAKTCTSFNF